MTGQLTSIKKKKENNQNKKENQKKKGDKLGEV